MRITKISVKGLFGMFDHEIPLNQESRITIVHGPNGVGKTVLMRMVQGFFKYEYGYFVSIPFEWLTIHLENRSITVACERAGAHYTLSIKHSDRVAEVSESLRLSIAHPDEIKKAVKDHFPKLERIDWPSGSYWLLNDPTLGMFPSNRNGVPIEEAVNLKDLLDSNTELHRSLYGEKPEWLSRIRTEAATVLIDTQRLHGAVLYGSDVRDLASYTETLSIGETHNVHLPFSTLAIESLLFRFDRFFDEHLAEFFHEQEKQRRLIELANMVSEVGEYEISNLLHSAADTAVGDQENEEYYQEMMLFVDLINERFLFKKLYFGMDDFGEDEFGVGEPTFAIYSPGNGRPLPFVKLSSGEQHLMILYYQLIFEIEPDTLVMIDEPELSMNVVWQRNFLKDLQRIIELRKFDVLIATHSPQIIHDKWDWMVPLGEPVDD